MKKTVCVLIACLALSVMACAFAYGYDSDCKLLVIMYHSVVNRNDDYAISPEKLEEDLVYLKNNGFETVTINDLINFVYDGESLPHKAVMITFDDGFYNNIVYAENMLKQYDMCGVLSVVGRYTDEFTENGDKNPSYAYVTASDIEELNKRGVLEIQCHSYDFHKINSVMQGSAIMKGESDEAYCKRFCSDTVKIQKQLMELGVIPYCYTYPYGKYCLQSEDHIKKLGFRASLSCNEGINIITQDPNCLYLIKRYNRSGNLSTEQFFSRIMKKY